MTDTVTEHYGDCCIFYQTETPGEYLRRTGEHIGGAELPLIGSVMLYINGKEAGLYPTRAVARDHMKALARVATSYPMPDRV